MLSDAPEHRQARTRRRLLAGYRVLTTGSADALGMIGVPMPEPHLDDPRELTLRDVRCFQDEQRGSLRPITLLVGENNTGKTTFLGCYSVLHRMLSGSDIDNRLDFNEEPFAMGSFRDIARASPGPGGQADEFKLGVTVNPAPDVDAAPYRLFAAFREEGSQPVVSSLRFSFTPDSFLDLQRTPEGITLRIPDHVVETTFPMIDVRFMLEFLMTLGADAKRNAPDPPNLREVAKLLRPLLGARRIPHELPQLEPVARYLDGLLPGRDTGRFRFPRLPEPVPVAPLRSKPRRTYDPIRETASPEGEHVPMSMMRLSRTKRGRWKSLHEDLVAFGRESGLFADVKVRGRGAQMSDPFQLQVKVRTGPFANIMDVGYGVSQSLPILVDVLTAAEPDRGREGRRRTERTFLLQQPEVHLHPRGQAELANLFVEAFRKNGSRFLIETHSDYIVDRVRIAVRKRKLKPDDVSLLYFEPAGNAVTIHNMTLDDNGNLRDAPAGYRDFFVKETDRLLGFAD